LKINSLSYEKESLDDSAALHGVLGR
jgi:hypothetical protein